MRQIKNNLIKWIFLQATYQNIHVVLAAFLMTCCTMIQNWASCLISDWFQYHILFNEMWACLLLSFQTHWLDHDTFLIWMILNQHMISDSRLFQYFSWWWWKSCDLIFMWACRTVQLLSDRFQVKYACCFQATFFCNSLHST